MKLNDDSFFAEAFDPRYEARALALEVVCRLLIWMADAPTVEDRGLRTSVALYCIRPDLLDGATPLIWSTFLLTVAREWVKLCIIALILRRVSLGTDTRSLVVRPVTSRRHSGPKRRVLSGLIVKPCLAIVAVTCPRNSLSTGPLPENDRSSAYLV